MQIEQFERQNLFTKFNQEDDLLSTRLDKIDEKL